MSEVDWIKWLLGVILTAVTGWVAHMSGKVGRLEQELTATETERLKSSLEQREKNLLYFTSRVDLDTRMEQINEQLHDLKATMERMFDRLDKKADK